MSSAVNAFVTPSRPLGVNEFYGRELLQYAHAAGCYAIDAHRICRYAEMLSPYCLSLKQHTVDHEWFQKIHKLIYLRYVVRMFERVGSMIVLKIVDR
ncbi:hypothetical protein A0H81_03171 [Grifola frondosa]|uniref:Uncharacterized protein n=1 Tax=Grifola frondosa TaxID=5627 RepID=A0A1C7MQ39_GRIFR|nr:hypothetical protein A0H81_03171 [Grifola frondosa]